MASTQLTSPVPELTESVSTRATSVVSDERAESALTVFACLWAFAALFHQSAYPELIVGRSALFVSLPAMWLLLKPESKWRLLGMSALQVLQVSWNGPAHASNHWVFVYGVNLTILLSYAWLVLQRRFQFAEVTRGMLFRAFVPVVRIELAIVYAYAVLHKMNTDFLNPAVSCASTQYAQIASKYTFLPEALWVDQAVVYGTLLLEAAIPVLLFIRRTRLLGVIIGSAFHFVLTINPAHVFFDFTSVVVATYFLFIPFDFWTQARTRPLRWRWLQELRQRTGLQRVLRAGHVIMAVLAFILVASYVLRVAPNDRIVWFTIREMVRGAWIIYFAGILLLFVRVVRRIDVVAETRDFDRSVLPWAVAAVMPILVILNGMTPYLGYKTEASFSMFSNLRTEGGISNHLFLGQELKIAPYQEDLVTIHESSDPDLAHWATQGVLVTWFEFRTLTRRLPGTTSVSFTRNGIRHDLPRIAEVAALDDGPTAIPRRLLRFRPVDPLDRPMTCYH